MIKVVFPAIVAGVLSLTSYVFSTLSATNYHQHLRASMFKAPPAKTFSINERFEIVDYLTNPCNGEAIEFTGSYHETSHGVINNNKAQFIQQYNFQGLSGVGVYTGSKYRLIHLGNVIIRSTSDNCVDKLTIMQTFKMVTAGADNNYTLFRKEIHFVNRCTSEINTVREDFTAECI